MVCTGGGIPGFFESSYKRFANGQPAIQTAFNCTVGFPIIKWKRFYKMPMRVSVSIALSGARTGSRTRLLLFAHLGLQCVSTVRVNSVGIGPTKALSALDNHDPTHMGAQLAELQIDPKLGLLPNAWPKNIFTQTL